MQLRALVAQARSLYASGASLKARDVLADLDWTSLDAYDRLEALLLSLDVAADLLRLDDALSGELTTRAQRWHDDGNERDRTFATIAAAWIRARGAHYRGDAVAFESATEQAAIKLRPLAYTADREAVKAFCRFTTDAARAWIDFAAPAKAEHALRDAQALLHTRSDLPPSLPAELHVQRARLHSIDAATFARWRGERDTANGLALEHALIRTAWLCHYLDLAVAIAREERARAVDGATVLLESAQASDSVAWQRIAAFLLARAGNVNDGATLDDLPFEIHRYDMMLTQIAAAAETPLEPIVIAPVSAELTPRQREIAELASSGVSNREIASRLGISYRTVENHLNTIFNRFEIRSRWQLAERLAAEARATASDAGAANPSKPGAGSGTRPA